MSREIIPRASKNDTVFVLIMHFLQNLSIANVFMKATIHAEM